MVVALLAIGGVVVRTRVGRLRQMRAVAARIGLGGGTGVGGGAGGGAGASGTGTGTPGGWRALAGEES